MHTIVHSPRPTVYCYATDPTLGANRDPTAPLYCRPGKARSIHLAVCPFRRLLLIGAGAFDDGERAAGHGGMQTSLLPRCCSSSNAQGKQRRGTGRKKGDRQTEAQSWPPRTAIPTHRNGTSASVHGPISLDSPTPPYSLTCTPPTSFLGRRDIPSLLLLLPGPLS